MKKNTYLFVALLSAGLVACNNEPSFKVEGTVAGAADKIFLKLGRMHRIFIGFVWITR